VDLAQLQFHIPLIKISEFYYISFCCSSFLGFDKTKLESMEKYLKAVKLFRNDENSSEPEYSQVYASDSPRSE
jgi:hypothetical protein